jgi:restriction system protein
LERLVLSVLTAMGYGGAAGAPEYLGKAGDEGLDGVIRQDPPGLDRIYVQAKRYGARICARDTARQTETGET